jgi:hypothetical protein
MQTSCWCWIASRHQQKASRDAAAAFPRCESLWTGRRKKIRWLEIGRQILVCGILSPDSEACIADLVAIFQLKDSFDESRRTQSSTFIHCLFLYHSLSLSFNFHSKSVVYTGGLSHKDLGVCQASAWEINDQASSMKVDHNP